MLLYLNKELSDCFYISWLLIISRYLSIHIFEYIQCIRNMPSYSCLSDKKSADLVY